MICYNCKQEIGDASVCPHCHSIMLKAPQPHHLPVGTVIGGRYTIKGVLGEGGFGITYLGFDNRLGFSIAIKEFFPHGFAYRNTMDGTQVFVSASDDKNFYEHGKERFLSEAKTLAKFHEEPGVVSVTDYVEENNSAYLIMEYIDGVNLMQYIKQNGVTAPQETFDMFEPVMRTLEKIHAAGVIHRDISPDNIMRLKNGQLKLMDFGSAREYIDENRSMSVMLKKGYAPIEQYHRNGEQGPWTDVYALCATIYHCITGKRPDDSLDRLMNETLQPPSALGVAIAPAYESLLMYGLKIRKEDRCQSMTELLDLVGKAKLSPTAAIKPERIAVVAADVNNTMLADNSAGFGNMANHTGAPRTANQNQPVPGAVVNNTASPQNKAQNDSAGSKPKKKKIAILISCIAAVLVIAIIVGIVAATKTAPKPVVEPTEIGSKNYGLADKETVAASGKSSSSSSKAESKNAGNNNGGDIESGATLKVWVPSKALSVTQTMCNDFIAAYPDKKITIQVSEQAEGDASSQLLNAPQAAADVFGFPCDQITILNGSRVLSPLFSEEESAVKARDTEASVNAATVDGQLLAFPETGENGYYLVYDKSIVSDEDAKTFEGVLEACRKAGRKFNMSANDGFYACMFPFTGGLQLDGLTEDGAQRFNNYDEEKVIDALEAFANLFHEYSDVIQNDSVDKTGSGMARNPRTVAAGIDGTWNASVIKNVLGDDFGAAKLPTINVLGEDTQIVSMSGFTFIGVNANSSYPNAAHALANYLTDEKCQLKRAEQLAWSPSNKNAIESDVVKSNIASEACLEQAKYSIPQVDVAETFWSPMGNLGKYLVTSDNVSRDGIRNEFNKTITSITDF